MPELPEVEIVKRGLSEILVDQPKIVRIEFMRKDLRDPMPMARLKKLEGAQILTVHRRAKYLIIETDRGGILSHLGMTGTWRVAGKGEERDHDHIYLHLSNGLRLAYRDPRRFGIFEDIDLEHQEKNKRLSALGPEPLDDDFNAGYLKNKLSEKQTSIKVAIMNQEVVVGVGNIYASEALFRSGIRPDKKAGRVSKTQVQLLVQEIKRVLTLAIEAGGSSISDFKNSSGQSGYFQNNFQVYDRKGEPCVVCATPIRSSVLGGRSTFWCRKCQS